MGIIGNGGLTIFNSGSSGTITAQNLPVKFVDTVTGMATPSSVYVSGSDPTQPALGATLTASINSTLPNYNGVTSFVGMKILLTNQFTPAQNGDYVVTSIGSASSKWSMTRITYSSEGFYPSLWEVYQGTLIGNFYEQTTSTLNTSTIGTVGSIVFLNVTPTSASGIWGISNSSGVYTYYTTLTLAVTAATSGQTIELFADVVESTNTQVTLKAGVDINFNGHSYTLSASGTASNFYVNYAGRNRFYNGKIIRSGGTANNANSACFLVDGITASYAYLDFFGVEIYSSFGVGIASTNNNTIPYVSGANIRTFGNGIYYYTGAFVNNCNISSFGGGGGVFAKTITNSYVETSAGGSAIIFPYTGRASNCYAYVYGSGSGWAIYCQSGVILTNCTAISTRNSAIYNLAAQSYNCYAYSTAGAGFECGSNSGGDVYNSSAYSTANSGILYAGTINGCNITSTLSYAVEGINGGVTSNVYNSYLYTTAQVSCRHPKDFMNNIITCTWNNVGGHGVQCLANNTITNNTIVVTNASANALNAGAAISLKYANNCFKGSTTPINANITQSVTNTQDNQGNILL